TAWQRFRLAVDAGEIGLARYLKRFLPRDETPWADRWLEMTQRTPATLRAARKWRDSEMARLLIRRGLEKLARSSWESASGLWHPLSSGFAWSDADRAAIDREIALFRAVDLDSSALAAIDALPSAARDQQILAWRARVAMAQDDWSEVLASIEAMSLRDQAEARWRFWR